MEDYVRKLALWHTKTFKPIMTHDELEPIMATLGFVGLPVSSSSANSGGAAAIKEYVFTAGGCLNPSTTEPLPRPRLPYPRIDALHQYTYSAFFDAVAYCIGKRDIADHFHVRGMPLNRMYDRPFDKKFRCMNDDDMLYVYRDGTLDQASLMLSNNNSSSNTTNHYYGSDNKNHNNIFIHNHTSNNTIGSLIPLKDIIV